MGVPPGQVWMVGGTQGTPWPGLDAGRYPPARSGWWGVPRVTPRPGLDGAGYPIPSLDGGYPPRSGLDGWGVPPGQVWMVGGTQCNPQARSGWWGVPHPRSRWGYPGVFPQPGLDWGVPPARSGWWGVPPSQVWMVGGVLPLPGLDGGGEGTLHKILCTYIILLIYPFIHGQTCHIRTNLSYMDSGHQKLYHGTKLPLWYLATGISVKLPLDSPYITMAKNGRNHQ